MITKLQYVEYLISTVANFTGTHLAEHLEGVSHDSVKARQTDKTLYQVKTDLLRDYWRVELRNPHVPAFQPA